MRRATFLCLIAVSACASAPGVESTADRSVLGAGADGLRISGDDAKVTLVAFPQARVWAALPEVYESLGMPIGDIDTDRHVIGNTELKVTKRLGKTPLSAYLDCGTGQGFQSADTYMIQLSVLSQLEEDKSGLTKITTLLQATGKSMAFAGVVVRCTSKYALEALIADGVKAQLKK